MGEEYSERKSLKHTGSTVLRHAAPPEEVWTALATPYLTGTSVAWTKGKGKRLVPRVTGAVDKRRLLASLGHMNWAISKVSRGKMNPANELIVHSRCASPGSKVGMFNSRHPRE